LLWSWHSASRSPVYGWVRGCGRAGGVLAALADGRGEVSREVENKLAVDDHVVVGLFEIARKHLIPARVEVYHRPYADIDDAQEALVLLLELLLVKDLNREDALFVHFHVEALVPVGVQRLLDDARGARLLAIDRGHGEGVRKSEHIALVEPIGGDDGDAQVGLAGAVHDARICSARAGRAGAGERELEAAVGGRLSELAVVAEASSRRAVVVVMYGVSGLRRSDEGVVQVLEEAVRCQGGRAQSIKANAAGVHGPARRAPGLRWQLLIQSFAIAASRYPASVSAVQARRLGR